jgi:hypothetical protein
MMTPLLQILAAVVVGMLSLPLKEGKDATTREKKPYWK